MAKMQLGNTRILENASGERRRFGPGPVDIPAEFLEFAPDLKKRSAFPENFDARTREALEKSGVSSLEQARGMDDEALLGLDGIGEGSLKKIRG